MASMQAIGPVARAEACQHPPHGLRRIRMTRARAWRRDHPDAVIVDRRTPWGNPFRIGDPGVPDARAAVRLFRAAVILADYGRTCTEANPSMLFQSIMEVMPGPVPRLDVTRRPS